MSRAARIGIFCVSVAIFCFAGIGHVLQGRASEDKAYKSLTVYGEVLQKIQQDYVDDPNMRTVTAGSLHGMLESLDPRSEEHTSELQSHSDLVCRLLLEKKKNRVLV